MRLFIILCQVFWASAQAEILCPENRPDLFCLPSSNNQNNEINETNFYTIAFSITGLFQKEIREAGYPLTYKIDWQNPYFGAGVTLYENSFQLMIFGGTTRLKEMTREGYAAIVCHEIGHIIGGLPQQTISGAEWSSSEGQSDFFAASVCLPRYFKSLGVAENNIGARVEKAGFDMLNALKKFDTNSKDKTLSKTLKPLPAAKETLINTYPSIQCRYENFRNPTKRPVCWFRD